MSDEQSMILSGCADVNMGETQRTAQEKGSRDPVDYPQKTWEMDGQRSQTGMGDATRIRVFDLRRGQSGQAGSPVNRRRSSVRWVPPLGRCWDHSRCASRASRAFRGLYRGLCGVDMRLDDPQSQLAYKDKCPGFLQLNFFGQSSTRSCHFRHVSPVRIWIFLLF